MSKVQWWNGDHQRKTEETGTHAAWYNINLTWSHRGLNPRLLVEKPAPKSPDLWQGRVIGSRVMQAHKLGAVMWCCAQIRCRR